MAAAAIHSRQTDERCMKAGRINGERKWGYYEVNSVIWLLRFLSSHEDTYRWIFKKKSELILITILIF